MSISINGAGINNGGTPESDLTGKPSLPALNRRELISRARQFRRDLRALEKTPSVIEIMKSLANGEYQRCSPGVAAQSRDGDYLALALSNKGFGLIYASFSAISVGGRTSDSPTKVFKRTMWAGTLGALIQGGASLQLVKSSLELDQ